MHNVTIANNTVVAGTGGQAGEGGKDGNHGVAQGGGLNIYSGSGVADEVFVILTDVAITGNTVQASSSELLTGAGLFAEAATNVAITDVNISENFEAVADPTLEGSADPTAEAVDGYFCEGILDEDGNCASVVRGDADRDGDVDMEDFLALANAYGKEGNWEDGDFDSDGIVGYQDFLFLAKNFGSGPNA